jgi:hypothetical protein
MKAKKKFPDLNKDGKITKADILKGRGVFKKGGKIGRGKSKRIKSEVDFDMNLPTPEVRSKSANIAKSKMKQRLAADLARSKGGRYEGSVVSGRDVPEVKLYQDQKTGEYIARPKLSSPAYKKGGKMPKYKKGGGMSGLSAAQKEVYRRGLAAYMSSGNRPKVSQHAWAMARVKSDFGKREAAKIRAGKGKKKK